MTTPPTPRISISSIEKAVCLTLNVRRADIFGDKRARRYSHPRQIAMSLARQYTRNSYPQIGAYFCRDHTTVIHAVRQHAFKIANDESYLSDYRRVEDFIAQHEACVMIARFCRHLSSVGTYSQISRFLTALRECPKPLADQPAAEYKSRVGLISGGLRVSGRAGVTFHPPDPAERAR